MHEINQWAYVVGIVLGGIALLTASLVWWRHQTFGAGGSVLSLVGVLLVGMSVWTSAKFSVGDIKAEFDREVERINKEVDTVAEAGQAVTSEVKELVAAVDTTQKQFVSLTNTLERTNAVRAEELRPIRTGISTAPRVNVEALERATHDLSIERRRPRVD